MPTVIIFINIDRKSKPASKVRGIVHNNTSKKKQNTACLNKPNFILRKKL
jgi:hypothetical protein